MIGMQKNPEVKNDSKDDFYALTVTFKDLHTKWTAKEQFKQTYKALFKILEESTEYEMFPEWRITTNSIHYHGTIIIKDRIKWHKSTYTKLSKLGFMKLKKVDELQGWLEYTQKESRIANEILGINCPFKNGCLKHTKPEIKIDEQYGMALKKYVCNCIECRMLGLKQKSEW